jgi:hypothetical protein
MGILKGLAILVGIVSGLILGLAVVGLLVNGTGDYGLQAFLLLVGVGGVGMVGAIALDRFGKRKT